MGTHTQEQARLISKVLILAGSLMLAFGLMLAPAIPYVLADAVVGDLQTAPPLQWHKVAQGHIWRASLPSMAVILVGATVILAAGALLGRAVRVDQAGAAERDDQ